MPNGNRHGRYRSGLEKVIGDDLDVRCPGYTYEGHSIWYQQPVLIRSYTPDYVLPNGIVIEAKGRFLTADRQKHKWLVRCWPDLDIRFVFSNELTRIGPRSPTTYRMWCEKYGFQCASKLVPDAWIQELPEHTRLTALMKASAPNNKAEAIDMFERESPL